MPRAPAPRAPRRLWIALLIFSAACATATSDVRPEAAPEAAPDGPEVANIEIDGADALPASEIKKKILTSESGLGFWPFGDKAYFDPNAWQADLRRIERYYQARGYYQAEVEEDQVIPKGSDQVVLRVKVREGGPTRISKLTVRGMEGLPEKVQGSLKKAIELEEGKVFQEDDWTGQKAALQAVLKEASYADAAVEGEVNVDVATRQAEVILELKPGQPYIFDKIFISQDPNPVIPPRRIIDQVRGAIKEDAPYSESALAEAQARVFKMGVFGGVKVNRAAPDRSTGRVPVVVDVREAPFHTLKWGFGFGIDQTRNEGRALAEYTDRNFNGDLRRLTLRAKAGYALLPGIFSLGNAGATKSGFIFNTVAELEQPRFLFRDVRGQVSVGGERDIQPAYEYLGGRAKLGVIWQPHPAFSIYPSYNFEGYGLVGNALPGGTSPALVLGCREARPGETCFLPLSYLEQVIEWDRRDDRTEPHRGFYLALALQEGGGPLGGVFNYLRVLPDARYYQSFLDNRLTVAVKVRAGTLISGPRQEGQSADSPIVSRFFSGGNFMRGFGDRRLSPLEVVPDVRNPANGTAVPIGGNGLFESSLELRYSVTEKLVVAAFLDTGFVTRERFGLVSEPDDTGAAVERLAPGAYLARNLQYAVGLGIRYRTVVGPIRMDLAYRFAGPPLPLQSSGGLPYTPSPGCFLPAASNTDYPGSPEGRCMFHLSIGEAF